MKDLKIGLIAFFSLSCISLQAQFFEAGTTVSIGTGLGYNHPQICLNSEQKPMVLWTSGTAKTCNIALQDASGNFPNTVQLNPSGLPVQSYNWSGPDLARWNQNVYVAFKSDGYETGHLYLVKSTDDGQSFGDTVRIDQLSAGYSQYPDVAVYKDTVYVTFMAHDAMGMNPQYVVTRSTDGGQSFSPAVAAGSLLGDEACDCCPGEIIVNDQAVIVLFRNNDLNVRDIKGVVSFDRGLTFTDILEIDQHNWTLSSCPSTGPDPYLNGADLYTVYKTEDAGVDKVFLNQFDLSTMLSVSTVDLGENLTGVVNYPQIAGSGDTLGVVFEGFEMAGDIFFAASYNGAGGLNVANRMNVTSISGSQNKPDVAFAKGKFHIVYNDLSQLKYVDLSAVAALKEIESATKHPALIISKAQQSTIKSLQTGNCEAIDLQGKTSMLHATENGELSILNLEPGIYFLRIREQHSYYTQQLIITP